MEEHFEFIPGCICNNYKRYEGQMQVPLSMRKIQAIWMVGWDFAGSGHVDKR